MDKKIETVKQKLKGDIYCIYIIFIALTCLIAVTIFNTVKFGLVPASEYKVELTLDEMSEDTAFEYYSLYIDGENMGAVDYNEMCSDNANDDTDDNKCIKTMFLAGEVEKILKLIIISVVVASVYFMFDKIKKGESPFQRDSVKILRCAAILIIVEGILPGVVKFLIAFFSMSCVSMNMTFDPQDIFIVVLGIVVGMISEVFRYGCDLQEDSDLIA